MTRKPERFNWALIWCEGAGLIMVNAAIGHVFGHDPWTAWWRSLGMAGLFVGFALVAAILRGQRK